jgi:poly-gamma-glutamate synthesis protein (capsule biosynthesis protein)
LKKPIQIHDYAIVKPYTIKGKIIVAMLKFIYSIVGLFMRKKWESPIAEFEENPVHYRTMDIAYLGYKYYIKPPWKHEPQIEEYFESQTLDFTAPDDFILESQMSISAGGDLMPYERISKQNTQHLWDDIGAWFFGSDIVFANLETPICKEKPRSHVPEIMLFNMLFNGDEELWDIFSGNGKYKGFDIVSTANNHSYDMGLEGLEDTLDFLKSKQVEYSGTNYHGDEKKHIPILERKGIKIAFIAYTYSLNHLEVEQENKHCINHLRLNKTGVELGSILADVQQAKAEGADFIVLSLHTGNAYQSLPSAHTINIYHRIFEECGVDIILGSHPHNPQPMEQHEFVCPLSGETKKGFAIYSLADFVAYDIFVLDRLVPLLKMEISKGKQAGKNKTMLTKVECMPAYNWSNPLNHELRFFNLFQLQAKGYPAWFSNECKKESQFLFEYANQYLIHSNRSHLLAKTD